MENDILTQLADFIDSKMKEFMTTNEELKEFQHTCDEFGRIGESLKTWLMILKEKLIVMKHQLPML